MRKLVMAGILAGLFASQLAHALSLEISPATQTGYLGESLTYDLWVKGIGSEIVAAFDVDITYSPGVLNLSSVVFGTGLNGGNPTDSLQLSLDSPGTLNLSEVSLLSDADLYVIQQSGFVLATFAFTGLKEGATPVAITLNAMAGHAVQNAPCNPAECKFVPVSLSPELLGAQATILPNPPTGIPEPSILALAGLGLLGMRLARHRRAWFKTSTQGTTT